jgi:DNA polymerase-3 subunit alpha
MENIPKYLANLKGEEQIDYMHPLLEPVTKDTYGVMIYQEQVMQAAQVLAGYTLGGADLLRRAMGKKIKEEMDAQRAIFVDGCKKVNNIDEALATSIFDQIEKFAGYGFNKSHAAAYAYLSYATAFFKANYPGEWMAALMTCDMTDLSKVAKHIRECQSMQIPMLPPDINVSQNTFVATDQGVRFALAAIKGVGEGVVETIVQERKKNGAFDSLYSFLERTESGLVGRKVIENLIQAGCFDFMGWTRQQLLVFLENHFDAIVKEKKDRAKGIMDMFAQSKEEKKQFDPPIVACEPKKLSF